MRFSFQTFCLVLIVTFIHFAVVSGVSRLGDGPAEFLSAVDGEALLESWLSDEVQTEEQSIAELDGLGESLPTDSGADSFPLAGLDEEVSETAEPVEESVVEADHTDGDRTAETSEYAAIVDARLLAGRIESPDPDSYFRNAQARPRREETEREPVEVEAQEKEAVARPKPIRKAANDTSSKSGPHQIRSIRPISG